MKKINILYIIMELIFLVIFNTIFYLVGGTEHNESVWISYGFIHFSYIMLLLTPLLTRKSKSSMVFGYELYSIGTTYFFVEFFVGLVFIFLNNESYNLALIVQLVIAGIYAVILLSNMIANEYTAENEEKAQRDLEFVQNVSKILKSIMKRTKDRNQRKRIEKVYDEIKSSQVKSHTSVQNIENEILSNVDSLENAVNNNSSNEINSLTENLLLLISDRNSKLKLLN